MRFSFVLLFRFAKWRERKSRIDKDVNRTDSSHEFFKGSNHKANVETLRSILLTYSMYNFDLGYCQVGSSPQNLPYCPTYVDGTLHQEWRAYVMCWLLHSAMHSSHRIRHGNRAPSKAVHMACVLLLSEA